MRAGRLAWAAGRSCRSTCGSFEHRLLGEQLDRSPPSRVCVTLSASRVRAPAQPRTVAAFGGYEHLREVLADPADEEHEEMLEWLDLHTEAQFDSARFDVDEVNRRSTTAMMPGRRSGGQRRRSGNDRSRFAGPSLAHGVGAGGHGRRTLESGRCHIPVADDISETEQPFNFRIESSPAKAWSHDSLPGAAGHQVS